MIRIGKVAERTGLTPRTIRYYEEIGLLPGPAARRKVAAFGLRRSARGSPDPDPLRGCPPKAERRRPPRYLYSFT